MNTLFQPKNVNAAAPTAPAAPEPKWKKSGFINLSLPDGNGGTAKLGSIGLEANNVRHQKLEAWLTADGGKHMEERLKHLLAAVVADYRSAEKDETVGFALPGME